MQVSWQCSWQEFVRKKVNLTLSLFQLKQRLVEFVRKIKSDSPVLGTGLMGRADRTVPALCCWSIWSLIYDFICSLVFSKMHFICSSSLIICPGLSRSQLPGGCCLEGILDAMLILSCLLVLICLLFSSSRECGSEWEERSSACPITLKCRLK